MVAGAYYQREDVHNLRYGEVTDREMLEIHTGHGSAYRDMSSINDLYKSGGFRELTTRARRRS